MTTLNVNGIDVEVDCDAGKPLLWVLREDLGLTGTKYACGKALCGACTVLIDGRAERSCTQYAVQAEGRDIVTVEGQADGGELTALQQAFRDHHALQCGFCTAGILASATHFLAENPSPSEAEVRDMLSGHICRCTGYDAIVRAILSAAEPQRDEARP